VSYDLRIYFPQPAFPAQAWYDMLASFRSGHCSVTFSAPSSIYRSDVQECSLVADHSLVDVGVRSMNPAQPQLCDPLGTHWMAHVSTGMGRSGHALWLQYAIPYHALIFFPGVSVHDCQYHVGRSIEVSSWADAASWLEFAQRKLWREIGTHADMIERGLFAADGTLRF
jgi:hypothetical protein